MYNSGRSRKGTGLAEIKVRKQHRAGQAQIRVFQPRTPGDFPMKENISLWQSEDTTGINMHIYLAKYPH